MRNRRFNLRATVCAHQFESDHFVSMEKIPGLQLDPAPEVTVLREQYALAKLELEALRSARLVEQQSLLKLAEQLDALVRSSSEVRYRVNADWSELAQLNGGGFIPDNTQTNKQWIELYIPAEHQERVRAEIRRAVAAKDTYNIEHTVNRVDGTIGWASSRAVPLFDENGEIESWMGAASDITARKTSEEAQRLLNAELAHRMKNTLTIVQAIVGQTLRASSSVESATQVINDRLQALASAQDILTQTEFVEADTREIVEAALAAHKHAHRRVEIVGDAYRLTPQQALGLSLSIHELATNAIKYGSLSDEKGRVSISWRQARGLFEFQWVESEGPTVTMPERRSFGSKLIERVAAGYFGGEALLDFKAEGLRFTLRAGTNA